MTAQAKAATADNEARIMDYVHNWAPIDLAERLVIAERLIEALTAAAEKVAAENRALKAQITG